MNKLPRWAPIVAFLLVALPTLRAGSLYDDWIQRAVVERKLTFAGPLELFTFASGHAEQLQPWIKTGPYPWYTLPELRVHFFRPISALLIAADVKLFDVDSAWPHLHSVLWGLLMVLVASALYRRVLGLGGAATLAALAFALDDAHSLPVSWLANRNAILGVTFAWIGLWCHLRAREDGWKWGRVASLLSWTVALGCSETAISAMAYVGAYELAGRGADPLRTRARAVAPMLGLIAAYALLYKLEGCGSFGSGTYLDPVTQPWLYLANLPERVMVMLGAISTGVPADLWLMLPASRPVLIGLGATFFVVWPLVWRVVRPLEDSTAHALRWLGLGAALSLLPGMATFPTNRLLLAPSLGLGAFVGVFLSTAFSSAPSWKRRAVIGFLVAVFLLRPAVSWFGGVDFMTQTSARTKAAIEGTHGRVVVLSSPDFGPAIYGTALLALMGRPAPSTWQVLTMDANAHVVTRLSDTSFEVRIVNGRLLESAFEENFRKHGTFAVGARVELDGLTIEVTEVDAGSPTRFTVTMALPEASYDFFTWNGTTLEPTSLPPVGQARTLEALPTIAQQVLFGGAHR